MEILTQAELQLRYQEIIEKIRNGAVFIYPTDTIYGIGGNALDKKVVDKIRQIKDRSTMPFSVWVPSFDWIKQNCVVTDQTTKWLNQLPGKLTLILRSARAGVAENVAPNMETIGVRHPDHWFHQVVKDTGVPLITTSANKNGRAFMTSLQNLDPEIERAIDFMIYEGEKVARPSKIVDVEKEEIRDR